jgi:hypothetical protein
MNDMHTDFQRRAGRPGLSLSVGAAIAALGVLVPGCGQPGSDAYGEEASGVETEEMVIGGESVSEATPVLPPPDYVPDTLFATDLMGMGASAAEVEGQVSFLSQGGAEPVQLAVAARGLEPGDHAWHIHTGPCGAAGAVDIALSETEGKEATVGPLAVDQTGRVDTTVDVPMLHGDMLGTSQRSLHIHEKPGLDHGPTVACATL